MKAAKASILALVLAVGLVGCGNAKDEVIECDKGDQIELDSDCGFWRDGQFNWYGWVVRGQDSVSPKGFEPTPDDETAPQEESSGGSGKSKKKRKH
jgi:hypothetical protein